MKYYITVTEEGRIGILSNGRIQGETMYEVELDEAMHDKIVANMGRFVVEQDGEDLFLNYVPQSESELAEERRQMAESEKNSLRNRRSKECFEVINRGKLWYARLTNEQLRELDDWYNQWLQVTDTMTVPQKPYWIK